MGITCVRVVDRRWLQIWSSMINNAGLGAENVLIHELEEDLWDKMMWAFSLCTSFEVHAALPIRATRIDISGLKHN